MSLGLPAYKSAGLKCCHWKTPPFNEKRHLNKQSLCDVEKCHNGGVQSRVITSQTKPEGHWAMVDEAGVTGDTKPNLKKAVPGQGNSAKPDKTKKETRQIHGYGF